MTIIELDDFVRFLLTKFDLSDIKESIEKVGTENERFLNPPPRTDTRFDAFLRHEVMKRKY